MFTFSFAVDLLRRIVSCTAHIHCTFLLSKRNDKKRLINRKGTRIVTYGIRLSIVGFQQPLEFVARLAL